MKACPQHGSTWGSSPGARTGDRQVGEEGDEAFHSTVTVVTGVSAAVPKAFSPPALMPTLLSLSPAKLASQVQANQYAHSYFSFSSGLLCLLCQCMDPTPIRSIQRSTKLIQKLPKVVENLPFVSKIKQENEQNSTHPIK